MAKSGSYSYTIAPNLRLYVDWTTRYTYVTPSCIVRVTQTAYIEYKGSMQLSGLYVTQRMPETSDVYTPLGSASVTSSTTAKYKLYSQYCDYPLNATSTDVFASKTLAQLKTTLAAAGGTGTITLNGTVYTAPSGGWVASASDVVIDGANYNAPYLTLTVTDIAVDNATVTVTSSDSRSCINWTLYVNGTARMTSGVSQTSWVISGARLALTQNTEYTVYATAYSTPENVSGTSNEVTFTTQAQDPPVITLTTGIIGSDYFEVVATSDVSCSDWKYTLDGGSPATVSGVAGTRKTITITALSPDSTHTVSVSAKSTVNNVVGTSETISVTTTAKTLFTTTTYSYALDSSLADISIEVQLAARMGGYQTSFVHDLYLSAGAMQSRQLLVKQTLVNGSNTVALSAADISWIDTQRNGNAYVNLTLLLTTYNATGTVLYGSDSASIIFTKAAPQAPIFTDFTYRDTNSTTTAITGNNQILIQGYSNLVVTATPATPQGDATIVSYSASFGSSSGQSSNPTINLGTVRNAGTSDITATATDSNGLTAVVAKSATSLGYSKITMGALTLTRNANDATDDHVYASVTGGQFNSILVGNVEKNALVSLTYQYRSSDSLVWSNPADILASATVSGRTFTLANAQLAELARDQSWYIRITASDKLTSYTLDGSVLGDVPLMSFRAGKVGVNNKTPNSALDVIGNIEMNGFNVQGFVRALGSGDNLNTILTTGIYTADPNGSYAGLNYPTDNKGVLEVIPETGGLVHRFTKVPVDGKVWIRHYTTEGSSFGQWYQLSGSGAFTQEQSDWSEDDSSKVTFIRNKLTSTSGLINDGSDGTSTYLESDETAYRTTSIPYGQVDGTSTNTHFTATVPGITALRDGVCMWLKNGVVTSASGFTIDVNGLGAKPSYSNMAAATRDTTLFNKDYTMFFVYDSTRVSGGCWICYRGYDSNTNTIAYSVRTQYSSKPAADKFYRYRLLFTSADNTKWVPANTSTSTNATTVRTPNQRPINPFGEIVYYGTTAAVEAGNRPAADILWEQYNINLGYSFNDTGAALVLTPPSPVYVKAAMQTDGSAIIDQDDPIVFSLPTTADGKIYIYLGRVSNASSGATTTSSIELALNHPVYYYFNGAIRKWIHMAEYAQKVEWTGIQNRPTLSHVYVNTGAALADGTYQLEIDDI